MGKMIDATNDLIYYPSEINTNKTLWLVRDVIDVDALRGIGINAACPQIKQGALERSARFFQQFPAVFVALGNGKITAEAVAAELADFCPRLSILTPKEGAFGKFRSVAEALRVGDVRADNLILGAVERPIMGLLDISKIKNQDLSSVPYVRSGIPALDRMIGGFREGEFTVISGKRGCGKSTLAGQFLLDSVEQGFPVCAYSGELVSWQFKNWIIQQAAGPQYSKQIQDPITGKWYSTVEKSVCNKIDKWLSGKFFLYDSSIGIDSIDNILEVFTYAVRRHSCCVFLVDNLMTMQSNNPNLTLLAKQSEIVEKLRMFSKKMCVHVFLVAHPRKGDFKDADDVSGNSEITNKADNVIMLDRLSEEERSEEGFDMVLRLEKNRMDGEKGKLKLCFDKRSRRFYAPSKSPDEKIYGWGK